MKYQRKVQPGQLILVDELGNDILRLVESVEENSVCIKLIGAIRNELAYDLEDELYAFILLHHRFILDFEEVTFIASTGLQLLLDFQKRIDKYPDGSLVLTSISGTIEKTFLDTGYYDLFEIK